MSSRSDERAFVDLHCHTRASFDALTKPGDVARVAGERGLTHIAITDHDRIDGALEARARAPEGLTVIIGEEVRTADGDLIALFLEQAVAPGLPMAETIEAVRAQGGLVGLPHPFDGHRSSVLHDTTSVSVVGLVDWIEAYNARVLGRSGNERAAAFARDHGVPGIAVSDAHSLLEVGVAWTAMGGDPSTPAGLRDALGSLELLTGRATYFVRALTPLAKVIQRARGNRRVSAAGL